MKNKIQTLWLALLLILAPLFSMAANQIRLVSVDVQTGAECTIEVQVDNTDPFVAFQADIPLPQGLAYVAGSIVLNTQRTDGHTLSASVVDQTLRILAYSGSNLPFKGTSGTLVTFRLKAGGVPGIYALNPQNTLLGSSQSQPLTHTVQGGAVTILGPNIQHSPDALDFGRVALTTSSTLYVNVTNQGNQNLVISGLTFTDAQFSSPESGGFTLSAGSSRQVSVVFAPTIKGTFAAQMKIQSNDPDTPQATLSLQAVGFAVNELHLMPVSGRSGYTVTLPIHINNMEPFTGFQVGIALPPQVRYVAGSARLSSRKTDHVISADVSNQTLIVTAFSGSNQDFTGTSGEVATLTLYLEGNGGYYPLNITTAIIADKAATNILSESYNGYVNIAAPYISIQPGNIPFGRIPVTGSAKQSFAVQNVGNDTLKVTSAMSNNEVFSISNGTFPMSIPPYQSRNLEVTFQSQKQGNFGGSIIFRSNDSTQDPAYLNLTGEAYEPNELVVRDAKAGRGSNTQIEIELSNYSQAMAFQFDLLLPNGITVDLSQCKLTDRGANHTLFVSHIDSQTVRVLAYSGSLDAIAGNSGVILTMPVQVAPTAAVGTYALILSNTIISDAAYKNISSGKQDGLFTITTQAVPTVLTPSSGGTILVGGDTYPIQWNDYPGDNVRIDLVKGGAVVGNIAMSAPNTGLFDWTIPTSLEPGNDYRIRVTAVENSTLTDDSDFEFSILGTPSVTYPSTSGIVWYAGIIYEITWKNFTDPYVKIELLKGETVVRTVTSGTANDGTMLWKAPAITPGNDYRIRITSTANPATSDVSDNHFTLAPAITSKVTYPSDPGIVWIPGTIYEITWQDFTDPFVTIELLKGETVVQTIAAEAANDGSLSWEAPVLEPGSDYRIRITSTVNPVMTDISDNPFTLEQAITAKITYPSDPGIVWNPGTIYEITWQDFPDPYVKLELLKGETVVRTITTGTANDGTMLWRAPSIEPGSDYRIRITSTVNPVMTDISDNHFTLAPAITAKVTYPSDPGIVWNPGTIYEITWQDFTDPYVKLELLKGETVVRTITTGTANDGSMLWRAPSIEFGSDYRIRITSTATPSMSDISDNYFTLAPSITAKIIYPSDPGIVWNPGTIYEITWQDFTDPYVKLELLKGETVVRTITTGTANDGTMLWRAPSIEPGTDYRIRITSTVNPGMTDISDNHFTLASAITAKVTYPSDPGIVWNPGTIYEITWQDFTDPYVKLELLKGETVVRTITTGTANDGTMLWRVASALEPGSDYRLRISSTANPAKSDLSDNPFTVTGTQSVTYPSASGIIWNTGTIYEITWQGFTDPYVKVELLKGEDVVRTITSATANDGAMLWRIATTLEPGTDYRVRITSTATPTMTDVSDNPVTIVVPKSAMAFGNDPGENGLSVYPNPFSDQATITYTIAEPGRTLLEVYDLTGRRVTTLLDATREAGTHTTEWNATDASGQKVVPGIYLVRIQSGGFVETSKLVFNQ